MPFRLEGQSQFTKRQDRRHQTGVRSVDRQSILRRTQALRKEEFAQVVLNSLTELTAFTRRLTRTAADADDLLQSTYVQAFRSWRSLRSPASARAWLFRIARNLSTDQHRSETARPELRLVESEGSVANQILPTQLESVDRIALGQALSRLSEEQAEAILLSDLWGFSYEEIAHIVGRPVGTVRSRIYRGRSRLLELLSDTAFRQGNFQR